MKSCKHKWYKDENGNWYCSICGKPYRKVSSKWKYESKKQFEKRKRFKIPYHGKKKPLLSGYNEKKHIFWRKKLIKLNLDLNEMKRVLPSQKYSELLHNLEPELIELRILFKQKNFFKDIEIPEWVVARVGKIERKLEKAFHIASTLYNYY